MRGRRRVGSRGCVVVVLVENFLGLKDVLALVVPKYFILENLRRGVDLGDRFRKHTSERTVPSVSVFHGCFQFNHSQFS